MTLNKEERIIVDVSEIFETFDIAELSIIINEQILRSEVGDVVSGDYSIDHLRPLYYSYSRIMDSNDSEEILMSNRQRFLDVCDIFLDAIEEKYYVHLDDKWREEQLNDVPAITIFMYEFYVLNHIANVEEALFVYIKNNINNLYKLFESNKSKKDASTLSNKKMYTTEFVVVISNLIDIISYILDTITIYDFFDNLEEDYIPLKAIRKMYEASKLMGVPNEEGKEQDFIDSISKMYKNDINYKSTIYFRVLDRLQNLNDYKL